MKRLTVLVLASLALVLGSAAGGQAYPNRPVRMVLPFPAGGTPDVPTAAEPGLPGFVVHFTWDAWLAPARTPRKIVASLQAEIHKAVQAPKVREFFADSGWEPFGSSSDELGKFLQAEIQRHAEIVRAANIKAE